MQHIYDIPAKAGFEEEAAYVVRAIDEAVADERATWFWQFGVRKGIRTYRRRMVNELTHYFEFPPGGAVKVPCEWLA